MTAPRINAPTSAAPIASLLLIMFVSIDGGERFSREPPLFAFICSGWLTADFRIGNVGCLAFIFARFTRRGAVFVIARRQGRSAFRRLRCKDDVRRLAPFRRTAPETGHGAPGELIGFSFGAGMEARLSRREIGHDIITERAMRPGEFKPSEAVVRLKKQRAFQFRNSLFGLGRLAG